MTVPPGVSLALDDGPLADPPTWTRIDDQAGVHIDTIRISRGRGSARDKSQAGTVEITGYDTKGLLDPTNTSGPFYDSVAGATKLDPLKQLAVSLYNPTDASWNWIYRGHKTDDRFVLDPSEKKIDFTLEGADMLEVLNDAEVVPDQAGNTVPSESTGDVFYSAQHIDDRIFAVLNDAAAPISSGATAPFGAVWPTTLLNIFTGNVAVLGRVYASRTTLLQIIDEACDAESPGVTNRFIGRAGVFHFFGRYARYTPASYIPLDGVRTNSKPILNWHAGDLAAFAGDDTLAVYTGLEFVRGKENLINAALVTPLGIAAADVSGQLKSDATSITAYGPRTAGTSYEGLITGTGDDGNTSLQETKSFGEALVLNYKNPVDYVSQLTFRNPPAGASSARAAAVWALLCGVELSDLITITSTHPGGGGFAAVDHFVEQITYELRPLQGDTWDVTLTLGLSPRAYFDSMPASWGH